MQDVQVRLQRKKGKYDSAQEIVQDEAARLVGSL